MNTDLPAYWFYKHRLSRNWAYPLKRSLLDAALIQAGVARVWGVSYSRTGGRLPGSPTWCPMRVGFRSTEVRASTAGLCDISVYAVPAGDRLVIAALLTENLASLCQWIRGCELESEVWRMVDHEISVEVRGGRAQLVESP